MLGWDAKDPIVRAWDGGRQARGHPDERSCGSDFAMLFKAALALEAPVDRLDALTNPAPARLLRPTACELAAGEAYR